MLIVRPDLITVEPAEATAATEAVEQARGKTPEEIAPYDVRRGRREFLRESLSGTRAPEEIETIYERIIDGNDLMPVSYLQRGVVAARAVARVDLGTGVFGTGFLIAPGVLITNNHVLPDSGAAARAVAQFNYEVDLSDSPIGPVVVALKPERLFCTSPRDQLDFSVVAVDSSASLTQFGFLPLLEMTGKASEGEWLTIIQHPNGGRKQVCVRENRLIERKNDVLWYSTDTEPGSSGAPVFNNDWFVVALHHAGVPETKDGVMQLGRDGSPRWIANEGIRASRIVQTLKQAQPDHPLLIPLYRATPATARIAEPPSSVASSRVIPSSMPPRESVAMAESRIVSVPFEARFQVLADGQIIALPQGVGARESFGDVGLSAEDRDLLEKAKAKKRRDANFDTPFDSNYGTRKGYDPNFLGNGAHRVELPKLSAALQAVAAPLLPPDKGNVLKYHNYSVVMHAKRRIAIYSAANVSFGHRFELNRPADVWRRDPRILPEHQLENFYYARNNFDRGHLTRREDLEFGKTPLEALESAADTCHWSNCTPQHARFNQNRETWQGIERHILETSILNGNFNAQIITGPVIDEGDPEYQKIKYPLQFWKVIAALDAKGGLFSTAFLASQEATIDQFGIEVTEVPIAPFKTFQVKISEVERLTGLSFVCGAGGGTALGQYDPLEKARTRPGRKPRTMESSSGAILPPNYYEIADLDDIKV